MTNAAQKNEEWQMAKWVYMFNEGNANMRELLGGKGANLAEMTNIGLPVPQGFTITTEACMHFLNKPSFFEENLRENVLQAISELEQKTGQYFCYIRRFREFLL